MYSFIVLIDETICFLALDRAINKFDHTLKVKFSTYAYNWFRQFTQRYVHSISHCAVSAENHWVAKDAMEKFISRYENEHDSKPTDEEVMLAVNDSAIE